MYSSRIVQPLSPPSSPRMSAHDQKPLQSTWDTQQSQRGGDVLTGSGSGAPGPISLPRSIYDHQEETRSGLRQTLPNFSDMYGNIGNPSPTASAGQTLSAGGSEVDFPKRPTEHGEERPLSFQHRDSVVMPSSTSLGQLMHSPDVDSKQPLGGDDDIQSSDSDEDKPQLDRPMTAAEIRQQKRKMKRFRLNHSQTRYLMGEFARQQHPDAAHRDRLSQEIPGLSPRQVQVWFQNR